MRNTVLLIGLIFNYLCGFSQKGDEDLCGRYKDWLGSLVMTELVLNEDSTFKLTAPDLVFPYSYQKYTTTGRWTSKGDFVWLNQEFESRKIKVQVQEKQTDSKDSIIVKVNYALQEYENEILVASRPFEFDMLTLKLNNKKKRYNFRHRQLYRMCLMAPKVKNQVILDSINTARIPRRDLNSISIYSYGFDEPIVVEIENEKTNYLEISITQPVDLERKPRNKKVIIKGNKAYFYERNGKIVTSGMLNPLVKQN